MLKIREGKKNAYYFNLVTSLTLSAGLAAFGAYETVQVHNMNQYAKHHIPDPAKAIPLMTQDFLSACRDGLIADQERIMEQKASSPSQTNQQPFNFAVTINPSQVTACAQQQATQEYAAEKQRALENHIWDDCFFGGLTTVMTLFSLVGTKSIRQKYLEPSPVKPNTPQPV